MRARDIMTRHLVTVRPDDAVLDAANAMLGQNVNAVLVCDLDGRLAGILSEADLMRRPEIESERERSWWLETFGNPEDQARDYIRSHARKVRDAMSSPVISVEEDATLKEIADRFERNHIKLVPVLRGGRPIGTVSRANLLQVLVARARVQEQPAGTTESDAAIRAALLEELGRQPWADIWAKNVIVEGGVVHLWGIAQTDREKQACRVAAESVPGVRAVENHLVVRNVPMEAY